MSQPITRILKIDSSARAESSMSRKLAQQLTEQLIAANPGAEVVSRDVSGGLPFVTEEWIGASYTPADQRTEAQNQALALSDSLIEEVQAADTLVIAVPMYNFSVPATLKAYIDQICRAQVTFRYTEQGPVGLLENKKAYVVTVTGGTPVNSAADFVSAYMRQVLGFIGIKDVTFINADRIMVDPESILADAQQQIAAATEVAAA
ncbi:Acyl carrier protein phosphodiesterase [Hahella chejuensis KCTC 2396]|uniref:FMN-dependent NADH:quinone oxidoreductase 1 n=1 Tax=Hahella chejuensis (strain KCTC 2396) TaxID=349521 RepID=AZOR1_HAHCH|nr:NAD(P)H-dependent oxidoreductase [Hahella chejuensis]Q2SMF5.1 RecName: Full=FMN-dependent NADH:quinone oxidoreductase 1; AltName: Full=Azo-dye reductase 1; AltName: Full=FMN-dependent NADH-azo compound oxidoreductase 1; AltName: Full=FMN-dependent NADH-azoreductase 1 [Hahella chejuensis KCTC 2396]ABC28169.1 Acyl carrier protein phosphodiesterase [Hahella chejuensis KCTC 2396]